jgi:hypothetical protein
MEAAEKKGTPMTDVIKQAREAIEAAGGLVTPSDVAREFGVSDQAIAQRVLRGAFPEPVAVLGRMRVYLGDETREFMNQAQREARRAELRRWIKAAQHAIDTTDPDEDVSSIRRTLAEYERELIELEAT